MEFCEKAEDLRLTGFLIRQGNAGELRLLAKIGQARPFANEFQPEANPSTFNHASQDHA
jgi:hypothetical protein